MRPSTKRTMRAIILAITATLAWSASSAEHCDTWTSSEPEIDTGQADPLSRHYVENDLCQICDMFTIWVYEESNGIDGLQRGDEIVDDTCHGMIRADTIIF